MSRRVLIVSQTFPPEMGGNASRIGDTATHLSKEGWDVTVVAPHPCYPPGQFARTWSLESVDKRKDVTVHRLWTWQPTTEDPGFIQRLAYFLTFAFHALIWIVRNGRRFDVVLSSTPPIFTAIPAVVARLVYGLPWVVDVRDLWIDAAASLDEISTADVLIRLSRIYQLAVFWMSDRIFTTTPELRSQLAATYATVSPTKTTVISNGVDTELFNSARKSVASRAIYTGNLGHAQALETVIRAMQYVESDITLLIVGDGDRRSALRRLTTELGLEGDVEFAGLVDRDRVPKLLASSAIGLAPIKATDELSYAVPTKAYEYMASGLPVVATGNGAVNRLLDEADAGVVVDDDPQAVATALDKLSSDKDMRTRFGQNGRQYVVRHRDRAAIAQKLSDELHTVVDTSYSSQYE